jgi:hypothetical protein
MQMRITTINDDFEREFEKDSVYLLEEKMLMEQEYREWLSKNRKPAKIVIVDKDKILQNESVRNLLPF